MGLPCAHVCDSKKATTGLVPEDFHLHWYWDRENSLRPLLDPLQVRKPNNKARINNRTGRILSTGEVQLPKRAPVCSACHNQGHTRQSRNCPLKLQASIATQSQILQDIEALQSQAVLRNTATVPALSLVTDSQISVEAPSSSIPTFRIPENIPGDIPSSQENSYGQYNQEIEPVLPEPEPEPESEPEPEPEPELQSIVVELPKELAPDRPEVLIQSYMAEKEAWLKAHPSVRPANYRKARKWKTLQPKILREQLWLMPRERRNLQGNIIASKANWTLEEITIWLDNEERLENQAEKQVESDFEVNGKKHSLRGVNDVWRAITDDVARDQERYIM
jgi:hypothetical protein